jgi:hypothetical protein
MSIKNMAIEQAVRLLQAGGASFHIKTDDGEWGGPIKKYKRNIKYPWGSLIAHIKPHIANVKIGDVVNVPFGEFDVDSIRSSLCGHLSDAWGNGSYMVNKTKTHLEVLRLS